MVRAMMNYPKENEVYALPVRYGDSHLAGFWSLRLRLLCDAMPACRASTLPGLRRQTEGTVVLQVFYQRKMRMVYLVAKRRSCRAYIFSTRASIALIVDKLSLLYGPKSEK